MELYIGNIPEQITDYDLRRFFNVIGEQASFHIVNGHTREGEPCHYGLADVESEKLGFQLMARFNNKSLQGCDVVVREFLHRNYSNDRRALNWRQAEWLDVERRRADRRTHIKKAVTQNIMHNVAQY